MVIPGSTVTIGTEPSPPPTASTAPPESSTATAVPRPTGDELVRLVGDQMIDYSTVHVDVSDGTSPPDITIDLDYDSGDLVALLAPPAQGFSTTSVRRVGDTVYVDTGDGSDIVAAPLGDVDAGSSGDGPAVAVFDLVANLRATLAGASRIASTGAGEIGGRTVEQYSLTIDAGDLLQPSFIVPDETAGPVAVVLSVNADGLPVRVEYDAPAPGTVIRLDLSAWGDPVTVEAPDVG